MFTHKDIQHRTIFVINGLEHRKIKVLQGALAIEDTESEKILTKIPFQKVLALFIVGRITITSPLIEKCSLYGVPIIVMKSSFRVLFIHAPTAEANYLLRQQQYNYKKEDTRIAKQLLKNKIKNQIAVLEKTRRKNESLLQAIDFCKQSMAEVDHINNIQDLMGIEGICSKKYFQNLFEHLSWQHRFPRAKTDALNATLDIGYTILFNFVECFTRLFGFDPYIGVYHQLWFKRKSLICDLVEPFRCIIDYQVHKSFSQKQFTSNDFDIKQNAYFLKPDKSTAYMTVFYNILVENKLLFFNYIRNYYRFFMGCKSIKEYQPFDYKNIVK